METHNKVGEAHGLVLGLESHVLLMSDLIDNSNGGGKCKG